MLAHLPNIEYPLSHLQVQDPILLGDLNMDLDEVQNMYSQSVADLLT